MAWSIRIERTQLRRIRSVLQRKSDRTHEPPNARKEEFSIAHTGLDLEGCHPEIAKIRRVTEVPEYQDGTKRHEENSHHLVRMGFESREDRNPRRGREL